MKLRYIKNLSSQALSNDEVKLLSRDLKFIPTPPVPISNKPLLKDFDHFARTIRLKYMFAKERKISAHPFHTNIPHNEGIKACDHFLRTTPHNTIPTGTLCDLIRMILTMNNFCFNDNHDLQIHVSAMGTKMAPSCANLFLAYFEANALENAPFQPHTWLRYIDDIFMIWTEGLDNLKIFIDYLNSIHPTIKFTNSHSSTNIPFLDVSVYD